MDNAEEANNTYINGNQSDTNDVNEDKDQRDVDAEKSSVTLQK